MAIVLTPLIPKVESITPKLSNLTIAASLFIPLKQSPVAKIYHHLIF